MMGTTVSSEISIESVKSEGIVMFSSVFSVMSAGIKGAMSVLSSGLGSSSVFSVMSAGIKGAMSVISSGLGISTLSSLMVPSSGINVEGMPSPGPGRATAV